MMLFRSTIHWSSKLYTSFTSMLGTSFQLTLCIQGLQPQKIELLPIPLQHTPQGCFLESLSECRFLLQIIILVFPMFTLRPLASRCFLHKFSLESSSFIVPAIITRLTVYKSSHGQPV